MSTTDHHDPNVLDAGQARDLLESTRARTSEQIDVRSDVLLLVWGIAWTVGYLSMWWSTRGQDPYTGPAPWAWAVLAVALVVAAGATATVIVRATAGISGPSSRAGTFYGLTWGVAFLTWQSLMAALADLGVSAEVTGILGAAMPAFIVAVIYCASAALWEEPSLFFVGAWLAVVTAAAVWTGPITASLLIGALGGLGFLLGAGIARRARS